MFAAPADDFEPHIQVHQNLVATVICKRLAGPKILKEELPKVKAGVDDFFEGTLLGVFGLGWVYSGCFLHHISVSFPEIIIMQWS